ncbi:MAG: 3-isopropylmalate dehydratase small subunit, partial [Nitrospirales bacterium]|nr:3-isopropylmalate dehydratase small subunit [Nitrospirales bacterium]
SSREHAPWALLDYGIRCIVAPSFADIFYNNCFQNGILPVELPGEAIQTLFDRVANTDQYQVTVDLAQQVVTLPEGEKYSFTLDLFRKDCLMKGLDGIGLTLQHESAITTYEKRRAQEAPWLFQDFSSGHS